MSKEKKEVDLTMDNRYKKVLLETMKAFIDFCSQNKLEYVAAYGTALGAVRHKGLIPWDDDIDVFMTRDNYEKFLECREKAKLAGYEIFDLNDEGYYLPFAKFCNANTTLWEVERLPFVMGVFIDVFPLDFTSEDESYSVEVRRQYKEFWGWYFQSLKKFKVGDFVSPHLVKAFLKSLYYSLIIKKKDIVRLENEIKKIQGPYRMSYGAIYSYEQSKFREEWFKECIEVPFEDFSIRIPEDYDAFLTHCYGNYMEPPPVEKRVTQHYHYFVDLERRLSIEDIKKIKNGK